MAYSDLFIRSGVAVEVDVACSAEEGGWREAKVVVVAVIGGGRHGFFEFLFYTQCRQSYLAHNGRLSSMVTPLAIRWQCAVVNHLCKGKSCNFGWGGGVPRDCASLVTRFLLRSRVL